MSASSVVCRVVMLTEVVQDRRALFIISAKTQLGKLATRVSCERLLEDR